LQAAIWPLQTATARFSSVADFSTYVIRWALTDRPQPLHDSGFSAIGRAVVGYFAI
jgi:hypothetical protein